MKKLTTGIFTVVLGLVAADANAAVTSRAYVDAKVKGVSDDLTSLSGTVAGKADKATTLQGYGITDAYTTTAADAAFANKATQTKVGTAELTTTAKDLSAAVNELNTNKVTAAQVNTAIETAISDTENGAIAGAIAGALADYTNTADMNTALDKKADKADTYTKTEVNTAVAEAKKAGTDAQSSVDSLAGVVNNEVTGLAATKKIADDAAAAVAKETTDRTAADTAIDTKIGTVPTGKTVVGMIAEAQSEATYDDTEVRGLISGNTNKIATNESDITTIKNSDVMKSGATKEKIDAIATNTANIATNATAIQTNADDIAANTTALEKAQADATQALDESIKKVTATGKDGTYVLTIKTVGDIATLKWEDITREDAVGE